MGKFNKLLLVVLVVLLPFLMGACSSYPEASSTLVNMSSRSFDATGITKIEANSYVKLYLQPAPTGSNTITVDLTVNEDQTGNMDISLEGDTLKITHSGKFSKLNLTANVSIPDIDRVSLTDHAQLNFYKVGDTSTRQNWDTLFEDKNFTLNLSDWADFDEIVPPLMQGAFILNSTSLFSQSNKIHTVNAKSVDLTIKPMSSVRIQFKSTLDSDSSKNLTIDTESSTIDLRKMYVETAFIKLYKNCDVKVNAKKFTSGSTVRYRSKLGYNSVRIPNDSTLKTSIYFDSTSSFYKY